MDRRVPRQAPRRLSRSKRASCAEDRRSRPALLLAGALAAVLAAGSGAHADDATAGARPDVATLLFATPQWNRAPAGSMITYDYAKKTSDASFGPSFDDHITLELGAGNDAASRTATVRMFSGLHALPAGPFPSDQQNPVLLLVFEQNVQELAKAFQANPRFFKTTIRKAWRDGAKIEPVRIALNGTTVDGTRVTVQPFLDVPEASKMKGLDGLTYVVEVADAVPGAIATIDIHAPSGKGQQFNETLRYGALKTP